jgi:hypothetical protein
LGIALVSYSEVKNCQVNIFSGKIKIVANLAARVEKVPGLGSY